MIFFSYQNVAVFVTVVSVVITVMAIVGAVPNCNVSLFSPGVIAAVVRCCSYCYYCGVTSAIVASAIATDSVIAVVCN